ncbi:hypothetical protein [Granulicella mallensis]|jgi:hypothetical protein|uniref:Uncharacterized protein n=1 Tax=Granulicella mallensis TaxID=940614 RepID=A0A7W7ZQR0_9BACT|nr:hypothetical protein [Granulicella mallensis]MBB5063536.1 hypothetical protein [Granulicella mallensis]
MTLTLRLHERIIEEEALPTRGYGPMEQQSGTKRPWEERVAETGARLRDEFQEELRRVVRFIDDEVVPEVRRNGSTALRSAASRLQQLAEHMDDNKHSNPGSKSGESGNSDGETR